MGDRRLIFRRNQNAACNAKCIQVTYTSSQSMANSAANEFNISKKPAAKCDTSAVTSSISGLKKEQKYG
eukprot:1781256-Ditylum_brightwellii.AAC.1